ncbi:MAG: hypothetical protein Q4Q18_04975 [Methanobrevibacter sp.]|nr:hypothetical protein [Methanobrevibacter sp.]
MQDKSNIDIENIIRMKEIARVYNLTKQKKKAAKYHKTIIKICDKYPKDEKMLELKIHSLNCLDKPYKSLENTNRLLYINPYNIPALINIAAHLRSD